jgi:hypothetical protein
MTATAHPCPMCGNDLDGHPVVCAGCAARGERDLRDLPRLTRTLLGLARDPTRTSGEPVSGSRERPLVLQVGIWSFVGLAPPGTVSTRDLEDALCQVGETPTGSSGSCSSTTTRPAGCPGPTSTWARCTNCGRWPAPTRRTGRWCTSWPHPAPTVRRLPCAGTMGRALYIAIHGRVDVVAVGSRTITGDWCICW